MRKLNFITDTKSTGIIAGSCGVIGIGIKKMASSSNISLREFLFPLSDKTSNIAIKEKSDFNLFFEELFPRAVYPVKSKNAVYFNLHAFGSTTIMEGADHLIFNSDYLLRCFHHVFQMENLRECRTRTSVLCPISTTELFPHGYKSLGLEFDIDSDSYSDYLVGHSLRPFKHDYIYTLEIMFRLNSLAKKKKKKGAILFVPQVTYQHFIEVAKNLNMSQEIIDQLIPIPFVSNITMRKLMRSCDFGLSFDQVVEAFGFYPLESVVEMCPVYTNGPGNVRHLLPKGCGIEIYDNLKVHFGNLTEKKFVLDEIAKKILRSIVSGEGKKMCSKGQAVIGQRYSEKKLTPAFRKILNETIHKKRINTNKSKATVVLSPYVRLADLKKGQFVTDYGSVTLPQDIKCDSILGKTFDREELEKLSEYFKYDVFGLSFQN